MSFLTHLECALCHTTFESDHLWNLCPDCHKPLLARYDLDAIRRAVTRKQIAERATNLWRYRKVLLVRDPRYALCVWAKVGCPWSTRALCESDGTAVAGDDR